MASKLYARYIPPTPTSVSKTKSQDVTTAEPQSNARESSPKIPRKKQKKLAKEESIFDVSKETPEDSPESPTQNGTIITKERSSTKDDLSTKGQTKIKKRKTTDEESSGVPVPKRSKKTNRENTELSREQHKEDHAPRSEKHKSVLSKFEKSLRITEAVRESKAADGSREQEKEPTPELHDLAPLPQPEQPPEPEYKATFSALPPWLAHPSTVSSTTRTPFSALRIDKTQVEHLSKLGYTEAFAVQAGLIPLLLPGQQRHIGDVCVSAATGSGKTLAYILPMVQSLRQSIVTKLRGLIVVPTRELVTQARKVAEECCAGTSLKVGIAVGNQSFAEEKKLVIRKGRRYDPEAARKMGEDAVEQIKSGSIGNDELLNDCINILPGHVPTYDSAVDILICTPGRLVEHINATKGFHLYDLQWLVIDEADRLLDQSFQGWAETLLDQIDGTKPDELLTARERIVAGLSYPKIGRQLTKVILSATMTRDLNKLSVLNLHRPKLLVVEDGTAPGHSKEQALDGTESFDIPATLNESALSVGDGSKKPLYLLQLLQRSIFAKGPSETTQPRTKRNARSMASSSESSSDSDSDSSSDTSSSDSDGEDDTASVSSSDSSSSDSDSSSDSESEASDMDIDTDKTRPKRHESRVLIFTNNNENASRLSKVLGSLHPEFSSTIGVLTKSSATSAGRKVLSAFSKGRLSILIASDRASRGLDVPDLTHIVNYDMPRSVVSYVHRVGRTARAGRSGEAWTLFTRSEARWFWNEIAKGSEIQRGDKNITRSKIDLSEVSDEVKTRYTAALEELRIAVEGDHTKDDW